MMAEKRYQVAIIGGGPAGLVTALTAAREGVTSILLIEKKREWGVPVQCAEYVPQLITQIVEIPPDAVANRIKDVALFLDGEEFGRVRLPGFILYRDVFEEMLAHQAMELGVECLQPATVTTVDGHKLNLRMGAETKTAHADIIVGADGPKSILRQHVDPSPPVLAGAVQYVLPLPLPSETAEMHFSPRYGAGYAWVFPRGEVANIGLAIDPEGKGGLKPIFRDVVEGLHERGRITDTQPLGRSGGLIPVGGPATRTVKGNMLLVGDAAGQTNPLTGAGIYTAGACGEFAGEAIARVLRRGEMSLLQIYEDNWRSLLGRFLGDALSRRTCLAAASPEEYADALRSAWRIKDRR